jgi:hypothetical protein
MSPQKRVPIARRRLTARILREQGRLEEAAVREQLELLTSIRRGVQQELADAAGYRFFHLSSVLSAIDAEIARGRAEAQRLAAGRTRGAFQAGGEGIDRILSTVVRAGRPGRSLVDVSQQLVSAAIDVTSDQLRSVWSELGTRLKISVRRAALGVDDPFSAMQTVAQAIKDPKTFGTAMNRAEVIIRTEVNRTFSMAGQKRMEQSNERLGGGLKKYWLDAHDARVRPTHEEAGKTYAIGGTTGPIPVTEAFVVGGEELMYPRDPSGSAEETINCRCVSVPYVEDLADDAAAA